MLKRIKNNLIRLMRQHSPKYIRHYLWPRRLHSKMFDWGIYYNDNKKIRVNFGAGPYFEKKGWISVDFLNPDEIINPQKNENYKQIDLTKEHDLNLGKIDLGYASHFCEHLNLNQLKVFLKNLYNNFNQGGILRLIVPDANLIMSRLQENDLEFFRPIKSTIKMHKLDFTIDNIANVLINQLSVVNEDIPKITKKHILDYDNKSSDFFKNLNENNKSKENKWIIRQGEVELGRLHMLALNYDILKFELHEAGFKNVYRSGFMQSKSAEMREVPLFDGTHPWLSLYIEAKK